MSYANILSVADTVYSNRASDGSYYTSSQLDVHANTGLCICYSPVVNGIDAPFLVVYAVDLIGNLVPLGRLDRSKPYLGLTAFGGKVQVKAYPGLSTPPLEFGVSVEAKGAS